MIGTREVSGQNLELLTWHAAMSAPLFKKYIYISKVEVVGPCLLRLLFFSFYYSFPPSLPFLAAEKSLLPPLPLPLYCVSLSLTPMRDLRRSTRDEKNASWCPVLRRPKESCFLETQMVIHVFQSGFFDLDRNMI